MAPRRGNRAGASPSTSSAAAGASSSAASTDRLRRTQRTASQSIRKATPRRAASASSSSTAAAASISSLAAGAGRRRRVLRTPPPGTRNITSRQNQLMLQAREQFQARERAGTSSSSRRAARVSPSPQLQPGQVLTEDEKLQREVQDLMADIGEDDRDPEYLKFLFSLDETMQEESDDSDFDGEAEDEMGDEEDDSASESASSDGSDNECESMDDEDEDADEEYQEGNSEAGSEPSYRDVLRNLMSGDFSDEDTDDYEPGVEEEEESSDDDEGEEFVLVDVEENAAAKLAEEKLRKKEDREERDNKSLLRTTEYGACTLCAEDTVVDPVGCVHCANFIGCRKCSNRWYRSSKANSDDEGWWSGWMVDRHSSGELDKYQYSLIAKCPLCRQLWPSPTPEVSEMKGLVKNN